MSGESAALSAESLVFSLKLEEKEFSEVKTVENREVEVAKVKTGETENRFARLKKSLRKRAASIL